MSFAALREQRLKDATVELTPSTKILVSALRAVVRLSPGAPGKPAQIRIKKTLADKASAQAVEKFDALGCEVRREGDFVIVEGKGPALSADLSSWWSSGAPELTIEIEAPQGAAEVSLRGGQVQAQNWKGNLVIGVVDGQVRLTGVEGAARVQAEKGEIRIDNHRGRLDLDTYGAKLAVSGAEGNVGLSSFSGEGQLSQIKGEIQVQMAAGSLTIAKSAGTLDFETVRGSLTAQDFDGAIRGQTDDGSVTAQLVGEADLNVRSKNGAVSVRLPTSSGAALRLRSEEGLVVAPESIPVAKTGDARSAQGRLGGGGPKGLVAINSQAGTIRVR
jgi:hypothetical protein